MTNYDLYLLSYYSWAKEMPVGFEMSESSEYDDDEDVGPNFYDYWSD